MILRKGKQSLIYSFECLPSLKKGGSWRRFFHHVRTNTTVLEAMFSIIVFQVLSWLFFFQSSRTTVNTHVHDSSTAMWTAMLSMLTTAQAVTGYPWALFSTKCAKKTYYEALNTKSWIRYQHFSNVAVLGLLNCLDSQQENKWRSI